MQVPLFGLPLYNRYELRNPISFGIQYSWGRQAPLWTKQPPSFENQIFDKTIDMPNQSLITELRDTLKPMWSPVKETSCDHEIHRLFPFPTFSLTWELIRFSSIYILPAKMCILSPSPIQQDALFLTAQPPSTFTILRIYFIASHIRVVRIKFGKENKKLYILLLKLYIQIHIGSNKKRSQILETPWNGLSWITLELLFDCPLVHNEVYKYIKQTAIMLKLGRNYIFHQISIKSKKQCHNIIPISRLSKKRCCIAIWPHLTEKNAGFIKQTIIHNYKKSE